MTTSPGPAALHPQAPEHPSGGVSVAPPPTPPLESVPAPRSGHTWVPGYWDWRNGHHVWVVGHWIPERRGYHWRRHHWILREGRWYLRQGGWSADARP